MQITLADAIQEAEEWQRTGFFMQDGYCGQVIYRLLEAAKNNSPADHSHASPEIRDNP